MLSISKQGSTVPSTSPPGSIVCFESVDLRYGQGLEIVQDITFSLVAGSFCFLTGLSGAGKSSLLSLMYLAQRPLRGMVMLFGQDISLAKRYTLLTIRRRLDLVFQEFRLLLACIYPRQRCPSPAGGRCA